MDKEILIWAAIAIITAISSRAQAKAKKTRERQQAQPPLNRTEDPWETKRPIPAFGEPIFSDQPEVQVETTIHETDVPKEIRRQIERKRAKEQQFESKQRSNLKKARTLASTGTTGSETTKARIAQESEIAENSSLSPDFKKQNEPQFDLRQAVIYSEILKPRFEAYD